jgi:hypothetical protein
MASQRPPLRREHALDFLRLLQCTTMLALARIRGPVRSSTCSTIRSRSSSSFRSGRGVTIQARPGNQVFSHIAEPRAIRRRRSVRQQQRQTAGHAGRVRRLNILALYVDDPIPQDERFYATWIARHSFYAAINVLA